MILAIDPGPNYSAYVAMAGGGLAAHGKERNADFAEIIQGGRVQTVVCEMVASYGLPVGAEIFDTCVMIGEFRHICQTRGITWNTLTRVEVKSRLCHHTSGVNDAVIRQRLLDLYGGKAVAIGNKANPGPLYGLKGDEWAALAVAKAWEMGSNKPKGTA